MHVYCFRITSEEHEDAFIDIELIASQTFLDFHKAIKKFCKITTNEPASFYLCDDKWRKKTEITLIDMNESDDEAKVLKKDETESEDKPIKHIPYMEPSFLNQLINNPHQKLIYVYDYLLMNTLYIELTQITKTTRGKKYPFLAKKQGEIHFGKTSDLQQMLEDSKKTIEELYNSEYLLDENEIEFDDFDDYKTDNFISDNDKE